MKQKIVFALLMGIFTTGIISFALIALNLEIDNRITRSEIIVEKSSQLV
nr:hypothetical protein [uncultured Flavobacterium sp.]